MSVINAALLIIFYRQSNLEEPRCHVTE